MKFLDTKFEDYLHSNEQINLHPELEDIFGGMSASLESQNNLILYGPSGTGKYTQALSYIKRFSPTKLKYERKMNFNFQNKKHFAFRISDVHFEIDMELLGCNARVLWNDIYHHILDILSTRVDHVGIILCKNFHKIHSELLDIFYSYMQTLTHKNVGLAYIILTEEVSFLHREILQRCLLVPVKRPTKTLCGKCVGAKIPKELELSAVVKIKDLQTKERQLMHPTKKVVGCIIDAIEDYTNLDYLQFRDMLYDIFIYHLDVNACILEIVIHFVNGAKMSPESLEVVLSNLYEFLRYYNNNYRPIYHLEKFMLGLCRTIHGI